MYLTNKVKFVIDKLSKAGFESYIVGGAVRDALRGEKPHDYDICTQAEPNQIKSVFSNEKTVDTGIMHGTVTVLVQNTPFEITTFRSESGYSDSRHPDKVMFVKSLNKDLARRDFTINAMAYSEDKGVIDLFGGKDDIKNGILRTVGNPDDRFKEDALRIMRGLRMASELGFTFDVETKNSIFKNANLLLNISSERILSELMRLLCGRYVGRVLREFVDVLGVVLPEILPMKNLDQRNQHHMYDVLEHSIRVVENVPADYILRFSALYHDTGKPEQMTIDENGVGHFYGHPKYSAIHADERCNQLRMSNKYKDEIVFLVEKHDITLAAEPHVIRKKILKYGEQSFRNLLKIKKADCIGKGKHQEYISFLQKIEKVLNDVLNENPPMSVKDLNINGYDLIELGFKGKQIGDILKKLLDYIIKYPDKNTKAHLTKLAKEEST